jgi:hypothetical protein
MLLVGTLASFVSFFGLAVASDWLARDASGSAGSQIVVQYRNGAPVVVRPHVRTRSS